jgi:hypothetical protein
VGRLLDLGVDVGARSAADLYFDLPKDSTARHSATWRARYCTDRRSPESVKALLQAGASVTGVEFPSSYQEVDELPIEAE